MGKREICEKVKIDEDAAKKTAREDWKKEAYKKAREYEEKGFEPYE